MDSIKKLNIAGKINKSFAKLQRNTMASFFTWTVVALIIIGCLFTIYLVVLRNNDLDVTWHEQTINMKSSNPKNIPANDIPSVSSAQYTLSTWFAIDKSQYNEKQTSPYSHLISYGHTKTGNETLDSLAIGAWLDNGTNNVLVVYRTDDDEQETNYNPNSDGFNCINQIELRNILLNEWNLISLVVDTNTATVYLNGQIYKTDIHNGLIYYDHNYPSLDICVAMDNNITGLQKSIRFRNKACGSDELAELYYHGPNKFVLPDIRGKNYIANISNPDLFAQFGSGSNNFLDKGADLVDGALGKMDNFFKSF